MAAKHDPKIKAEVQSRLLSGDGVRALSNEFGISEHTIQGWKTQAKKRVGAPMSKGGRPSDQALIGELLAKYLKQNIIALASQAEVFADEEWLRKQNAQELGVLHGILADKSYRLLEILSHAGNA